MKSAEIAYHVAAILFSGLAYYVCVFWGRQYLAKNDDIASGMIACICFAMATSILIPSIVGLLQKRLTLGGSIVQLVFLFLAFPYGLPLGIWGIILLRRSLKQSCQEEPIQCE